MAETASETEAIPPEVLAKYEPVIGLEVPVQLLTKSKIFCGCANRFGDAPNSNVCPVCLGLPGTLPVLNRRAVEMAMRASLAIHCTAHEHSRFSRKNYFYPDLPKGYQISQYELPLATGGWLEVEVGGAKKRIGITRLPLEEDAATGRRLSHPRPPDPALHRRQRLQHGRGLVALRRQCQPAPAWLEGVRHQGRSKKSKLLPLPAKGPRVRNRASHRRPRIRRSHRAGDAPLESSRRPHRLHAFERKSPRLPLFPGTGPAPRPRQRRLARRSSSHDPRIAGSQARPLRQLLRHYALRRRSPHQHASPSRL